MAVAAQKMVGNEKIFERIVFVFENGEGYTIPRDRLPGDDGSPVVSIQIADHRQRV